MDVNFGMINFDGDQLIQIAGCYNFSDSNSLHRIHFGKNYNVSFSVKMPEMHAS